MHLASLSFDVLVYLINFVDPVDRLNLLLSGILKGFENVSKEIDLRKRIGNCKVVLRPSRDNVGQLEIRSFTITYTRVSREFYEGSVIFELLAKEGCLKNNRNLSVHIWSGLESYMPWFLGNICFMRNLEKVSLWGCEITLGELVPLLRSCPKLVELYLELSVRGKLEMDEYLKDVLRKGFMRLRFFEFQGHIDNDTWPVIQEMLTWLNECVELGVHHRTSPYEVLKPIRAKDSSLTVYPTFAQNLQTLTLTDPPAKLIKWILPACLNIHTLNIDSMQQRVDARVKMVSFKKLKKLDVAVETAREVKEIFRNCPQVENLNLWLHVAKLKYFAELDAENLKEVYLRWENDPSVEDVLPVLKKFRYLQRLTLDQLPVPSFEVLLDFIMEMKHLTHLDLAPMCDSSSCEQLKSFRDEIFKLVSPHRSNFELDLTCDHSGCLT